MKTKTLTACLAIGFLTFAPFARAAGSATNANPHSAFIEYRHQARQTHRPAALPTRSVSGVIPRAISGGNPLQMLNPFAPAKYGTAEESVLLDPDVPERANGITFLSISF